MSVRWALILRLICAEPTKPAPGTTVHAIVRCQMYALSQDSAHETRYMT